jgi:ketosteroid isomerase-like protein
VASEDVELSLRGLEAFNHAAATGDIEPYLELLHPEISYAPITASADGTTYEGREAVRRYLEGIEDTWNGLECKPAEFKRVGNCLVMLGEWHATGRVSGLDVETPVIVVHEIRDGKIAWLRAFTDEAEALAAAEARGFGRRRSDRARD